MNKTRLLTILVIVLVVINLLALTALILGRPPGPGPGRMGPGPRQLVIERLQLDQDQEAAYDKIIEEHQAAIRVEETKMKEAKNALFALLAQPEYTEKDTLIQQIGAIQEEIEALHFKHFAELKVLCTPEQLPAFNELTNELARLFAPRPRPGR